MRTNTGIHISFFGTIYGINVCKFVQKLSLRDVQTVAGLLD